MLEMEKNCIKWMGEYLTIEELYMWPLTSLQLKKNGYQICFSQVFFEADSFSQYTCTKFGSIAKFSSCDQLICQ